jgi:hypothetical protein
VAHLQPTHAPIGLSRAHLHHVCITCAVSAYVGQRKRRFRAAACPATVVQLRCCLDTAQQIVSATSQREFCTAARQLRLLNTTTACTTGDLHRGLARCIATLKRRACPQDLVVEHCNCTAAKYLAQTGPGPPLYTPPAAFGEHASAMHEPCRKMESGCWALILQRAAGSPVWPEPKAMPRDQKARNGGRRGLLSSVRGALRTRCEGGAGRGTEQRGHLRWPGGGERAALVHPVEG